MYRFSKSNLTWAGFERIAMASGDNFSDIAFCLQKAKIQYKSARNIQQFKYIDVLFHFKMLIKLWQKITPIQTSQNYILWGIKFSATNSKYWLNQLISYNAFYMHRDLSTNQDLKAVFVYKLHHVRPKISQIWYLHEVHHSCTCASTFIFTFSECFMRNLKNAQGLRNDYIPVIIVLNEKNQEYIMDKIFQHFSKLLLLLLLVLYLMLTFPNFIIIIIYNL